MFIHTDDGFQDLTSTTADADSHKHSLLRNDAVAVRVFLLQAQRSVTCVCPAALRLAQSQQCARSAPVVPSKTSMVKSSAAPARREHTRIRVHHQSARSAQLEPSTQRRGLSLHRLAGKFDCSAVHKQQQT
jgi:hypothetical protein